MYKKSIVVVAALTLLACDTTIEVDPSNKVGEQGGKSVYQLSNLSFDSPRSRIAKSQENRAIEAYCGEAGGVVISTETVSSRPYQKPLPGGGFRTSTSYNYTYKFVCN